jgi:hypothetical protein
MKYQIPLDIRSGHATALFQIDAPRSVDEDYFYRLEVELDEQRHTHQVGLSPEHTRAQHSVS